MDGESTATTRVPTLAIITSLYRSAPYVEEFHARARKAAESVAERCRFVFVNDGSPDDALAHAVALAEKHPDVTVVDLSRNQGQHRAQMIGLAHADADLVFLIEVDLEERPEWLTDFYEHWRSESDVDVIYGVQRTRKGGWVERVTGSLFYTLFNMLSDTPIPPNHVTTRLMTRRYVNGLLQFRERGLFLGGVYELVGFQQRAHPIDKASHSETTYTLRRKLVLLTQAITSFSTVPLRMIFWGGVWTFTISLLIILQILVKWWFINIQPGFTTIVASIWAVGGMVMFSIGVLGIYLKGTLDEVKARPHGIIKAVYGERPREVDSGAIVAESGGGGHCGEV